MFNFFKHFALKVDGREMADYWLERLYISMLGDDTRQSSVPPQFTAHQSYFLLFLEDFSTWLTVILPGLAIAITIDFNIHFKALVQYPTVSTAFLQFSCFG